MVNVTELRPGNYFTEDGNIYQVQDILLNKTAMRKMVAKVKVRNLRSGAVTEMAKNSGYMIETIRLDKRQMQYLYDTGDALCFMDQETYEQIEIPAERLKWEKNFMVEGMNVSISFYETEILGVILPDKVELKVVHTEPAVKGNTTNNATKDAELESGLVIRVPLFVDENDVVIVSTSTGKYDSRA